MVLKGVLWLPLAYLGKKTKKVCSGCLKTYLKAIRILWLVGQTGERGTVSSTVKSSYFGEKQLGNILFWPFTHCMSYLGGSPWPGVSVEKILKFFVTYGTVSRMGHFVQTTAILGYWEVIFEKWYYKNKPPYFPTTFTCIASLKQVWKISEYSMYTRHVWDSFVWKIQWVPKLWLLWL